MVWSTGRGTKQIGEAGYIPRVFHLGDEAGQGNLADEGVRDVEKGAQAGNESGSLHGDSGNDGVAAYHLLPCRRGIAVAGVIAGRMGLDTRKDSGEQDRDEGKEGRERSKARQHAESPR